MILGFTGTRFGLTQLQRNKIRSVLTTVSFSEANHGDCIGGDEEFHYIALSQGIPIDIWPPVDASMRAFCKGARTLHLPGNYLGRNRKIVNRSEVMLGLPREMKEQPRGGTWSTIRYAKKKLKPLIIIYPDGNHEIIGDFRGMEGLG